MSSEGRSAPGRSPWDREPVERGRRDQAISGVFNSPVPSSRPVPCSSWPFGAGRRRTCRTVVHLVPPRAFEVFVQPAGGSAVAREARSAFGARSWPVAWRASRRRTYRPGMTEKGPRSKESAASPDSLAQYMREIGRRRLLTPADEVRLARRIERGDVAAAHCMV